MSNEVIATMVRAEQVGHPHEAATYRVPAGSEVYCVFEGVPDDCPAFGCFSPISMLACLSLAEFTDTVPRPGYAAVYGAAGLIKLGSLPTYPICAAVGSVALCGDGGPGGAFFCTKPAGHSAGHEARERATGRVILAWRAIEQDAPLTAAFPSGWIEKPFAVADDPDRATCHDDRMRRDFETWWDARGFKDQAEPQKAELAAWAAWVASSVTTRKAAP